MRFRFDGVRACLDVGFDLLGIFDDVFDPKPLTLRA